MKNIFILLLVVSMGLLGACANTLEGVGKDLEEIGKSIQENIDRASETEN